MDMILESIYNHQSASQFRELTVQAGIYFLFNFRRDQWLSFFGGKNSVDKNFAD
jgi:hypothetical protein